VGVSAYLLSRVFSPMRISLLAVSAYFLCVGLVGLLVARFGKRKSWMRLYGVILLLLIIMQGALTIALMFYENDVISWLDGWDHNQRGGDSLKTFWDANSTYVKYSLLGLFVLEIMTALAVCAFPQDMFYLPLEEDVSLNNLQQQSEAALLAEHRHQINAPSYHETGVYEDDYVNSVTMDGQQKALNSQKKSKKGTNINSDTSISSSLSASRSARGGFVRDLSIVPPTPTATTSTTVNSTTISNADFFTSPASANSMGASNFEFRSPTTEKYTQRRKELREKYGYSAPSDNGVV